jgi:hypothetical protein
VEHGLLHDPGDDRSDGAAGVRCVAVVLGGGAVLVLDGAPSLLSRTGFPSGFRQVKSSGRIAEVTDNFLTCCDDAPPGTRTPNPLILGPW